MKKLKNKFIEFIEDVYYPSYDKKWHVNSHNDDRIHFFELILFFPLLLIYKILK